MLEYSAIYQSMLTALICFTRPLMDHYELPRHLQTQMVEYRNRHIKLLAFIAATTLVVQISVVRPQQEMSIAGVVTDALTGKPIGGATIHIWGWSYVGNQLQNRYDSSIYTNETGHYSVKLNIGHYSMAVMVDYPETPGKDYIIGFLQLDLTQPGSAFKNTVANFQLYPGASVFFTGSVEFVELGRVPEDLRFGFIEGYYGAPLLNQTLTNFDPEISKVLGLEPGLVVVPSDMPILLYCESSGSRFIIDDDGNFFKFPKGSVTTVDLSWAVMNRNVDLVRNGLASTWLKAKEMGLNGIVVTPEIGDLETAFSYLDLARLALRKRFYSNCFINLRAAYIMDMDVRNRLESILSDATFSPIPLSFLLMLSGFGLASIFVEKEGSRIGAGLLISLSFLAFYYYVSPGLRLTDPIFLAMSNAAAAALAIGLVLLLPRVGKDVVTQSGIALASSLMSTFSLATRNLKRRKMRSSLMLASILTFVFGFMIFTSFRIQADVAFGRPASPYPKSNPPTGLMVVPPPGRTTPNPLSMSLVEALRANPLVVSVAPKTETSPYYLEAQLIGEDGQKVTIRGAIGVSGDEANINNLDAAVIEGHYFTEDENAILISKRAANQLGIVAGGKVKFAWVSGTGTIVTEYMVAGILDDQMLEGIVDFDGQPIRPYIFMEREKVYLSPENVVVFNWQELIKLKLGELTRIDVKTISANDITPLATDLARKWRYFVYASAGEGVKLFHYRKDLFLLGGTTLPMVLALVGLNVLACTLNAVYERKREIATLSLVGLNPSQISYMFLAESGLVAFIGGIIGYLFGVGVPRFLLSVGGPGFLTEKVSWTWSIVIIVMAVTIAISASVLPAMKASTIATPKLPLKWKLDYIPAAKDMWLLHVPQLVSQIELRRFFRFVQEKFEEMQMMRTIPEKMEFKEIVEDSDQEKEVKKLIFSHSFAQEGSRAFRTENELALTRSRGSSTYSMDLVIKIAMLYNYEPMEVVKKTASAVRRLMLQWAAVPSSVRWGRTRELLRVENISLFTGGKPVLRGISMSALRGEIIGLVGEGRRALILAIAGLFKPTSGSVTLDGIDTYSRRSEIKDSIGLLLNRTELYGQFSPRWNLLFLGKLDGNVDKNTINDLLEKYNLTQHADKKASNLNQEIKRKLMIVQALIKRPSLLLLEEPLAGLKDQEAKGVEALLKNLSRWEGLTIICTGRNAQELTFCNKILSLKKGTVEAVIETERQEIG